jgi:hypothetical protein
MGMDSNLQNRLTDIFRELIREEITNLLYEKTNQRIIILQPNYSEISVQTAISNKIGWLKSESILKILFKSIFSLGFIICDYKTFEFHFFGINGITGSIIWLSDIKQLVYLFNQLQEENFIPSHNFPHQLLKEHFLDKSGNQLKNGSLRSSLNTVKNNKRIKIIDNIIEDLRKA